MAARLSLASRVRLNNGVEMPWLGLGVWRAAPGGEAKTAVLAALRAGYRHIDTAAIYRNEADVGAALRESKVPREEVFVVTKLWNDDHGYQPALRAFDVSLKNLGLDYVDLYLIHWPQAGRLESWRALEKLYEDKRCRAIGVSNFTERHLDELLAKCSVRPAVNQVELHPFVFSSNLLEHCRKAGVQVEAYSPLTKGRRLEDPRIAEVARRVGRTPAQVLIRWCLQHDLVVIPKSSREERIRENAQVFDFELSPSDMAALDALADGGRVAWDPSTVK